MALQQDIQQSLKQALKDKNTDKVSTLRMLLSAAHNRSIELRAPDLDDKEMLATVRRELKKRQDAMAAYQSAGRNELYTQEEKEAKILSEYLPSALPEEKLNQIIDEVIKSGLDDFGLIMKSVMAKTQGQADGTLVSRLVKAKIADGK